MVARIYFYISPSRIKPVRSTPTRWCLNAWLHVRPNPGLTILEFKRVTSSFARTLKAYLVDKRRLLNLGI